jgi:hypothetical protein
METNDAVLSPELRKYFLKYGFNMIISTSGVPKVQVLSDDNKVIYQANLNSTEARKKSNKWLSLNTILLSHTCGFAHNNKEADELIEKKLTELWGNPAYSEIR